MKIKTVVLAMPLVLMAASAPAADGPELYRRNCIKCHGETGQADSWRGRLFFSRDFSNPRWQANNSDDEIIEAINRGPRLMPAFRDKLTEEEKKALLPVIRGFALKKPE